MKLKLLFILILPFLGTTNILAQGDFIDGYIVTKGQDTIHGQVIYLDKNSPALVCTFRHEIEEKLYKPTDILGFGYLGRYYTSEYSSQFFLEVLIEGEINLFRYKKSYLVFKENMTLPDLAISSTDQQTFNQLLLITEYNWKGRLTRLISDCETYDPFYFRRLNYSVNTLTNEIRKYNECKNNLTAVYNTSLPRLVISFGASYNYYYSNIAVKSTSNVSATFPTSFVGDGSNFGLSLEFMLPRKSKKTSFKVDVVKVESKISSRHTSPSGGQDINFRYQSLYVPILLKYDLFAKDRTPFILTGCHYLREAAISTQFATSGFYHIGVTAGIGYQYRYKSFLGQLAFRYDLTDILKPRNTDVVVNNNVYGLSLTFLRSQAFGKNKK